MIKTFIESSYVMPKCITLNKLNLKPKISIVNNLKLQSTISSNRENDCYRPFLMNYSTQTTNEKEFSKRIKEIQRHEKLTPYLLFVKEKFNTERQAVPNAKPVAHIKSIAEKWRKMSEIDKKPYFDQSNKIREEQKLEKSKLLLTLSEAQVKNINEDLKKERVAKLKKLNNFRIKREKNLLEAPKRPKTAFLLYCETLDRGEARVYEFTQGAAERWKRLAKQDQARFVDRANELMEQYKKDYAEWEKKMLKIGKKKLIRKKTLVAIAPKEKRLKKTKLAKKKLMKKKLTAAKVSKKKANKKTKTAEKKQVVDEINQAKQ